MRYIHNTVVLGLMNSINEFINNWKSELTGRKFTVKIFVTISILVIGLIYLTKFLTFIEYRPGIVLPDPVLDNIKSYDLSFFIFVFTYGTVLSGSLLLIDNPRMVFTVLHSYMIILIFRVICLYLVPLEAPKNIIPLHDAILESSFYSGRLNLKDLFFSGHTAALCLFYFAIEKKTLKYLFLLIVISVGLAIILQHVHYTIDVVLAPLFAWISYKLATYINHRF